MKKFLHLATILILSFVFLFQSSPVYGASVEGNYEYVESGGSVTITRYKGAEKIVNIPSKINNKPVTRLHNLSFCSANSLSIEQIIIPDTVETIGQNVFSDCWNLKSINIPKNVSSLDSRALYNCSSLTKLTVDPSNPYYSSSSNIIYNKAKTELITCAGGKTGKITLPSTVTTIKPYAFANCAKFTSITLSSNLKTIEDYAFMGSSKLSSISIPSKVTTIKIGAFANCSITSVSIPAATTNITGNVFTGCTSLSKITVSSSNPSYISVNDVVYSKDKKKILMFPANKTGTFTIPTSVTSIGDDAFSDSKLSKINLPYGITSIGDSAFFGCKSLTSVNVPPTVKSIGSYAFGTCPSLETITIPSSVTNLGDYVFALCMKAYDTRITVKCVKNSEVYYYILQDRENAKERYTYKIVSTDESNGIYKMSFNPNSGKLPASADTSKKVTTGKLVGTLPTPTRAGYVFKGWYTGKTSGSKITSSSRFYYLSNKTIYARWEKVSVAKASIKSLSAPATKQLKVSINSVSGAKGYEIRYSTSSKFTSSTTKKVTTTSTSKVLSGLSKNKTYYVKVRAYKLDSNNNKVYGSFSSVKSKRTI